MQNKKKSSEQNTKYPKNYGINIYRKIVEYTLA